MNRTLICFVKIPTPSTQQQDVYEVVNLTEEALAQMVKQHPAREVFRLAVADAETPQGRLMTVDGPTIRWAQEENSLRLRFA